MFVCVFSTLSDRASTVHPVIYAVVNPVRDLLDRKTSERAFEGIYKALTRASKQNREKNDQNTGKKERKKERKKEKKKENTTNGINSRPGAETRRERTNETDA